MDCDTLLSVCLLELPSPLDPRLLVSTGSLVPSWTPARLLDYCWLKLGMFSVQKHLLFNGKSRVCGDSDTFTCWKLKYALLKILWRTIWQYIFKVLKILGFNEKHQISGNLLNSNWEGKELKEAIWDAGRVQYLYLAGGCKDICVGLECVYSQWCIFCTLNYFGKCLRKPGQFPLSS